MEIADKIIVVTGGASGIGRALCRRFAAEGAKTVVVSDRDSRGAKSVAAEIGGVAIAADVANEQEIIHLVEQVESYCGPIDLFCSNAGILSAGGPEAADDVWHRSWDIHVMAHVYTARALLPRMLERGRGYLLQTASAAGLLNELHSAAYATSKHAAVGFAEWLAFTYGGRGIKVSCLCPMGVFTDMLNDEAAAYLRTNAVSAEDVAETVVRGLATEQFLILPHPEVQSYFTRKAVDHDSWLRAMQQLRTGNTEQYAIGKLQPPARFN